MCTYLYVRFVIGFFPSAPLWPYELIISMAFSEKVRQYRNTAVW